MGLDLYAGTLTRYCSGEWLTTVQRASQSAGIPCEVAYASGTAPWIPADAASHAVDEFRVALSRRWGDRFECFQQPPNWNEEGDTPYHTEKPDDDGVRSLVLVAAYLERPDLTRPVLLPESGDRAYDEAGPGDYYMGNMAVLECHLYLPGHDNFVVVAEDPLGVERFITSVGILRATLDDVNGRTWQAAPELLESWYLRGLLSFGPVQRVLRTDTDSGRHEVVEEPTEVHDLVEHNAQYALACLYRVCDFAQEHDVPIVVDR